MTLIDLKMDLDVTNVLLERLVVALEVIAEAYKPPPAFEPRQAGRESLAEYDPVEEARRWKKVREDLGLSVDEWETAGRWPLDG